MPAMASITVKKADETTNITYDALTPSGGDAGTARWRQDTGAPTGLPTELRSTLFARTIEHNGGKDRKGIVTYRSPYAYQDTTTGLYSSTMGVSGRMELVVPKGMPANAQSEGIRQFCNLLAAALIKQMLEAGYAP